MYRFYSHRLGQFVLVSLFIGSYALGAYGIEMRDAARHWWGDAFWTLAALLAALRCFFTAYRETGHISRAWYFVGYACLSWFLGMLVWSYQELIANTPIPFPGYSDIGFILFAPLLMAGIIEYRMTTVSVQLTVKQISELGLILSAILVTAIILFYQPIREMDESLLYVATALAYPVLYMGVFFFGLTTPFIKPSRDKRHIMTLLLLGVGVHAVTDTIYAYSLLDRSYDVGNYIDIFWLFGFALVYWAAFEQRVTNKRSKQYTSERPDEESLPELAVKRIEVLLPAIILLWFGILFLYFYDKLSSDLLFYLYPVGFAVAAFIAMLAWSDHKIQEQLYAQLLESKQRLDHAFDELEERVEERTRDLSRAKQEAEEANDAKSRFLSSMSHELRTPMNAILGFAQLMELDMDKSMSSENRDNIREILRSGEHLLSLINEVLDLQRIEAGRLELDIADVHVDPVVADSLGIVRTMADKRNIELRFEQHCETAVVRADRLKLKQILINLLSNAIKYNRDNGNLVVRCLEADDVICIEVTDSGIGISHEDQENIFEPFVRLGSSNIEGAGIGLAVTRELLQEMGGHITVTSQLGKGSTFSIFLDKAGSVE